MLLFIFAQKVKCWMNIDTEGIDHPQYFSELIDTLILKLPVLRMPLCINM